MHAKIIIPFLITSILIIVSFFFFQNLELFFNTLQNRFRENPFSFAFISFIILASDIVLPVPSSIVMFVNGYVLGTAFGAAISLIASLFGSVLGYYIGSFTSFGLKSKSDNYVKKLIETYGPLTILISRGIPVLSESVSIVCGYNQMSFKSYFTFNLFGYIPICLIYSFFGNVGYDKHLFLISFGFSLFISAAFWFLGKSFLNSTQK
jgi:uncharacterized membrane protein YdjX (TVP38/TMEM64 family)